MLIIEDFLLEIIHLVWLSLKPVNSILELIQMTGVAFGSMKISELPVIIVIFQ